MENFPRQFEPEEEPKNSLIDRSINKAKIALGLGATITSIGLAENTLAQTADSVNSQNLNETRQLEKSSQQPKDIVTVDFNKKEGSFQESEFALFTETERVFQEIITPEDAEKFCYNYLDLLVDRVNGLTKEIITYNKAQYAIFDSRVKLLQKMYSDIVRLNPNMMTVQRVKKMERLSETIEFAADSQDFQISKESSDAIQENIASMAGISNKDGERIEINPDTLPPFLKKTLIEFNKIESLFKKLKSDSRKDVSTDDVIHKKINVYKYIKPEDAEKFCVDYIDTFVEKISKEVKNAQEEMNIYAFDKEWSILKSKIFGGIDLIYDGLHNDSGIKVENRRKRLGKIIEFYKDAYEYSRDNSGENISQVLSEKIQEINKKFLANP